jgi:hypothetical protein
MFSPESSLKKVIASIALFTIVLLFNQSTHASDSTAQIENINQAIQQKLDFYNKTFPEIQFVHLKNGEWEKSLQALELFIGYQATNLDYEHPADLREALLFATVEKIQMMLVNGIASSYLFKVGESPAASRKHACVIILDPKSNVFSNKVATEYFIELPDKVLASLPEEKYLDKEQHLDFIIDHEAFHCLDTFQYGGIPMSENTFSTPHSCFMRESQADMFAIAMNLKRHQKVTDYVNKMVLMRGMTLLNGEIQHNSVDAIQLIINTDIQRIISSPPRDLVAMIKNAYKTIAPDYKKYMLYQDAALGAMDQLGIQPIGMSAHSTRSGKNSDKGLVNKLLQQTYTYYQQYTGNKYPTP